MEWPKEFYELRRGHGCPMCAQGRPDETEHGVRFFAGEVADAYLQRASIQRGYTVVVWHVIPRYADDPRPGWPFPFPEDEPGAIDEDELRRDVEALRG
ncbi:MAG TPA: hypothetical protein VMG74_05980 [Gaiellaceae bacterium]|nr:hypothetical protein [Gaiellaceae bacterium]